ncbi:MAG: hypothetical protein AAB642_03710 [Patescibacteria group bacterium]
MAKEEKQQTIRIKEVWLDQIGREGGILKGRIAAKAVRGNEPASGFEIHLVVAGHQTPNSPLSTDGDGEVADEFSIPVDSAVHRILIEARAGNVLPTRRMIDLTATTTSSKPLFKKVDKLDVVATAGSGGGYTISVTAAAEDGSPITGVPIVFSWLGQAEVKETDKGLAQCKLIVSEGSCVVEVQCPGIETRTLRLVGPKPKIEIPPIPEERLTTTIIKKTKSGDIHQTKRKGLLGSFIEGVKWGIEMRRTK